MLIVHFWVTQLRCVLDLSSRNVQGKYFLEHKNQFEGLSSETDVDGLFLFSIVAPELSQFNTIKNKAEIMALKVLYVQQGRPYGDFSIGHFSMKPSFVEEMETFISKSSPNLSEFEFMVIKEKDRREARIMRIRRMETEEWQFNYLKLFFKILSVRFSKKKYTNKIEKLKFYASAYNCGFLKSEQYINQVSNKEFFPLFSLKKFKYKDVAEWFYLNTQ